MDKNKPLLIVGLGNPGAEYEKTRHNAGFIAVDILAGSDAKWKGQHRALVAKSESADGQKIIFAKPQTFMNLSGTAVSALMTFYKIPIENLIVIHDDMDLKMGELREKIGGGSAGHNGIKNIDANIGKEYKRIRIGIGHPRDTGIPIDPADWVLGKFSNDQMKELKSVISVSD